MLGTQVIAAGKPFQGNQLAPHMLTQGKQVLQGQAGEFLTSYPKSQITGMSFEGGARGLMLSSGKLRAAKEIISWDQLAGHSLANGTYLQ